jgi:abortive infection bacteriophage resistance protein
MSTDLPEHRPSYAKPRLSYADQVKQLVSRGLVVADGIAAQSFLSHVNYYRFSGHCLAFEEQRHVLREGVTFEQVRASYDFDLVLRDLVTEALEVLEVDVRAAVAYNFGLRYGAFGHVDPGNFYEAFGHDDWIAQLREEAERSREQFIEHFRNTYAEYPDLPIWIAMEVLSFGALSKMFHGMFRQDQRAVAIRYRIQSGDLVAILHHLVYVRNLCAHHSRLWDRLWAIKPSLPKGQAWQPPHLASNDHVFSTLVLMYHLMTMCPAVRAFAADWRNRVNAHLVNLPAVPDALARMGMLENWNEHPIWTA